MPPRTAKTTRLLLILSCLLAAGRPGLADETTVTSGNTAPQSAIYVPPPPPPPQQQDRKQNNGAAVAAAAIGAAMAGASCAMLMSAARQEQDPTMKRMLMAQALQQCGQAAASALNAAQNKDNGKKLQDDTPKQGEIKTETAQAPTQQKNQDTKLPTSEGGTTKEEPFQLAQREEPADTDAGVVDSSAFDPKPSDVVTETEERKIAAPAESITTLKPIPDAKVGFDDANKQNSAQVSATQPPAGGFSGAGQSKGAIDENELKKLTELVDGSGAPGTGKRRGERQGDGSGESGGLEGVSVGSGKGAGEDGDDGFAGMLAQLMGAGGAPAAGAMHGGGGEYVDQSFGATNNAAEELPNIFQYAAFRYRKHADEKRLLPQAKNAMNPTVDPLAEESKAKAAESRREVAAAKPAATRTKASSGKKATVVAAARGAKAPAARPAQRQKPRKGAARPKRTGTAVAVRAAPDER